MRRPGPPRMARRRTVIRRRRRRIIVGGALVLAGGAVAYKLGTRDAERIENHTGKPVEDLSDEELERSMDELGIEKQTVREEDVAKLEAQGETGGEVPSASYLDELERLGGLRDRGIITEEEFQAKKRQVLGL